MPESTNMNTGAKYNINNTIASGVVSDISLV